MKGFYHRNSFAALKVPQPVWGPAALALTALSTIMGVVGQVGQQNAQAQAASVNAAQARYQAQVTAQNQALMERQAADAMQRGWIAEENRRRLTTHQIGQQQAGLAAQGTDLAGSPTDILGDTAAAGEVEARAVRSQAERQAYEHQIAGVGYGNSGILLSSRALNSTYQPNYLGAGASLLSGASTLAEKWRNFQLNSSP
ncbi:hypothetical protein [uncultured Reyranella sp.]|uniref:hypothetical protein n=1 Tax=uncultured Reyranella sp. TaxID=735512 RepID=UPI0025F7601F|nr:hypothetical protein [uncultured Reyranella sp.]